MNKEQTNEEKQTSGENQIKTIKNKHVKAGLICIISAGVFVGLTGLNNLFFIPLIGSVVLYMYIDSKYLRCTYCKGFINLDKLVTAKKKKHYCNNCGEPIRISK